MQQNTTTVSRSKKKVRGRVAGRQPSKNRKKPLTQKQILMIGLGGGVALGIGFLAYNHFKNKAAARRSFINDPITIPSEDVITKPSLPVANSGEFPVKIGSRGNLVAMIQNALLAMGGQPAMIITETSFRNGRVDGIFGKGTQRALQAAGFPSAITQSVFTSLVKKIVLRGLMPLRFPEKSLRLLIEEICLV